MSWPPGFVQNKALENTLRIVEYSFSVEYGLSGRNK